MPYYWENGGVTALATGIAAGVTTVPVTDASVLPGSFPYLLQLWDAGTYANPNDDAGMEIVQVTAAAGNTLTITRAQDGTTDQTHSTGEYAANNLVAEALSAYLWVSPDTTEANTVQPYLAASPGLTLKMHATQSADIFRIVTSADSEILAVTAASDVELADGVDIIPGSTTGTKLATATTQKLGFYAATPVVQPSGANQAAMTFVTISDQTFQPTYSQSELVAFRNNIDGNFDEVLRLVHQMRTDLVTLGLLKGTA
jgi:hypothetical protein